MTFGPRNTGDGSQDRGQDGDGGQDRGQNGDEGQDRGRDGDGSQDRGRDGDEGIPGHLAAENLFRSLVAASPAGALVVDDTGTIVFCNATIEDVLGYQPDELVGEPLVRIVVDEHRPRIERAIDLDAADGNARVECCVLRANGTELRVDVEVRAIEIDGEGFLAAFVRDLAAYEKYELATERYEAIADVADVGVYQLDRDGHFVMVNDYLLARTGHSREEFIGEHVSTFLDEEAIERCENAIEGSLVDEGEPVATVEFDVHTADGKRIPCEDRIALLGSPGAVRGTIGLVRDITERRARAEALRKERGLIEHVLKTSPVGIGVITPDGDISRVNDRAEELLGLTIEEITNQTFDVSRRTLYDSAGQRVPPEDLLRRVFEEGEQVLNSEFTLERPDGDRVWAAISIAPMTDATGDVEKAVLIATDITDRKEREETLREERDVIEHVLETSPVGIGVITPDGDISRVNDRAEELFGLTDYELSNRTFDVSQRTLYDSTGQEILPEELLDQVFEEGERVLDTEFELGQPDGGRVWLSISIAPIEGPGGTVEKAVIIGKDVTDRREREETLREERDVIEHILRTSPVGIGVITPDGDISRVNDRAEELLGLTIEEITNQTFDVSQRKLFGVGGERVPPEDLLSRVFEEGEQVLNSEFTLERPDGDRVWAAISIGPIEGPEGAVEKAVLIATDISDRKERERRMRESEARLRQIAENINSAIWMADADLSEVLYINPAYETITGRPRDSVYGNLLHHLDAVHPQDRQRVANTITQAIPISGDGADSLRFQEKYRIVRPDGSTRWVNSFAFPLRDDDGEVYRFVGVIDDITEVKEQQLELGRQRDELETLNQINMVIRQINQGLVQATSREEIERHVCDTLTDSKLYHAAWIGAVDGAAHRVEPKTGAGVDPDTFEESFDADAVAQIATAVESSDLQIISDVGQLPSGLAVEGDADESTLVSERPFAAVIPIVYKETVYDVLVAYTSRANAFGVREQAVLLELGKTIGLAINAAERKKSLLTDRVVEIEFELSDPELFFARASAELDAAFELEGITSQSDGSYLQYVSVTDGSPERVVELATADPSIEHVRIVSEREDATLVEFLVADSSPASVLAEYGATVTEATFADGSGTVIATLSSSADVRTTVEAIRSTFPGADLVGKRERERPTQTDGEFRTTLEETLTERQRATLETAYFAGFFEWPRNSSGEEVAESLDIAPATFHQHTREGARKLVETLVEGATSP